MYLDSSISFQIVLIIFLFSSVRPYTTEVIDGNNGKPVLQDSLVTLMCRVDGARPAAVITWYNGTTPFNQQSAEHIALKVNKLNSLQVQFIISNV